MSAHVIIGVDGRVDADGALHPWRIAVVSARLPGGRIQHLAALPADRIYVSPPRHPLYGDLTRLGSGPAAQLRALVKTLASIGATEVHVAKGLPDAVVNTLIWNGVEPRMHDVDEEHGAMLDTFSIGGDAGHQAAVIETKLRSAR